MRILPKTPAQQIERLSVLLPAWAEDPAAIGLKPARVAAMQALLEQAKTAHAAALAARLAAQNATLAFENATSALVGQAGPAIMTIKGFASASADPGRVLVQASLPERTPDRRTPRPPPAPINATVTIDQLGRALITWKTGAGGARGGRLGRQTRGSVAVMYIVERTDPRTGTTITLDTTARPRLIDPEPLPSATTYTIRAVNTSGRRAHNCPCTTAILNLPDHSALSRRAAA